MDITGIRSGSNRACDSRVSVERYEAVLRSQSNEETQQKRTSTRTDPSGVGKVFYVLRSLSECFLSHKIVCLLLCAVRKIKQFLLLSFTV